MAKSDPTAQKRERKKTIRWVVTIFLVTIMVSGTISLLSDLIMAGSSMPVAFLILFVIILVGIIFDIIGMAVTCADEKPFHSMASRKVPGAQEAIRLLRNAERVSSICNDVVVISAALYPAAHQPPSRSRLWLNLILPGLRLYPC